MGRKTSEVRLTVTRYTPGRELPEDWVHLAEAAKEACCGSYSPYSGFCVGAAVELADGTVIQGANQENASYPCGLCAERVALFSAMARGKRVAVQRMAIAARNAAGWVQRPVTPCGACRQVMLEVAATQQSTIAVLMIGEDEALEVGDARGLLPLAFELDNGVQ